MRGHVLRSTYGMHFHFVHCSLLLRRLFARAPAGTGANKGGNNHEVARLVETLALGSVGKSTQKNYLAKWNTWVKDRQAQGQEPWLHTCTLADPKEVLSDLLGFMASRCFAHNNRQHTVKRIRRNQLPRNVRRMGVANVALHDSSCGRGDKPGARHVKK